MRERTGNSKGVGFARVDYKDTCEKIIKELNGRSFPGNLFIICPFEKQTRHFILIKSKILI